MDPTARPTTVSWHPATNGPSSQPPNPAWLDVFWGHSAPGETSPPPTPEPQPSWPLPEPGTMLLLALSIVTALWQRLQKR